MKKLLFAVLLMGMLTGCQPAIISSAIRDSDHQNPFMETRCESCDMRDAAEMKQVLSKYDGWRLIYLSEYTTGNRFGTVGTLCFERPIKK